MGRKSNDKGWPFVCLFAFFLVSRFRYIHLSRRGRNGCWPCARNQSLRHTCKRERGREKKQHKCALWKEQIGSTAGGEGEVEGEKANLFTRSLKYKLQEARTFWWTSNSLPSTIIFRSVNSFALRCWFNSFNISVEQEKKETRQCHIWVYSTLWYIYMCI